MSSKSQTIGNCKFNSAFSTDSCINLQVQKCANCTSFRLCNPVVIESRNFPTPQNLSICAMFKSQSQDLPEWLSFHILQGVEHFYLYDNKSPDRQELAEILTPYIKAGYVTYVYWPDDDTQWGFQTAAINDCVKRFGESRFTAVLDVDEFLLAPDGAVKVSDKVDEIFRGRPRVWSLGVPWMVFGTNGFATVP